MDFVYRDQLTHEIDSVQFQFYTPDEIRRMSVKLVNAPNTFDRMRNPVSGGLYDPAFGPLDPFGRCATCFMGYQECPGHMGHLELALPMFQPLLFRELHRLLKASCHNCHHFRLKREVMSFYINKLKLINQGSLIDAQKLYTEEEEMDIPDKLGGVKFAVKSKQCHLLWNTLVHDFFLTNAQKCAHCGTRQATLKRDGEFKLLLLPKKSKGKEDNSKGETKKNAADFFDGEAEEGDDDDEDDAADGELEDEDLEDDDEDVDGDEDENGQKKKKKAAPIAVTGVDDVGSGLSQVDPTLIHPLRALKWLERLFVAERDIINLLYGGTRSLGKKKILADPTMFFFIALPVAPSKFRPPMEFKDQNFEHQQNLVLSKIVQGNIDLMQMLKAQKNASSSSTLNMDDVVKLWQEVQNNVNVLVDSTKATKKSEAVGGIRQELEKKEGLLRMNMMGKRVNFACRSVISPDPYIGTDEIGIPEVFATRLSFPEPVTAWNVGEMRQRVINGPFKHPGANYVIDEMGHHISLLHKGEQFRTAMAKTLLRTDESGKGRMVGRHMQNGDVVIANRQPTLHRASIMAHKVRVMPGQKTIRMHYANCNSYNADFDGDEINVHFPQSQLCRSEALTLAITDAHYISPCNAKPLRGLIQDHVVSGVLLSKLDTFLSRSDYNHLVYQACCDLRITKASTIITLPPAILKPKPLWTGKQVVSTILHNILPADKFKPLSVSFGPKVKGDSWNQHREEGLVRIVDNELITGVVDKAAFGASEFGLVHAVQQTYGHAKAGVLLSVLGRLFTCFLQLHGFTCGMQDLMIQADADTKRRKILEKADNLAFAAAAKFSGVIGEDDEEPDHGPSPKRHAVVQVALQHKLREDPRSRKMLDGKVKQSLSQITSEVIDAAVPIGQVIPFPTNTMALMTTSGAKGSKVNHTQICCLLGQQELEGLRVPLMSNGKSLPCFSPFDTRARAGGFVGDRFLTGIRPQEYYFHCMAGREGLVDTAVKTSRSGYLQRCLMKHLEGICVSYDYSARDNTDGSIIQFAYGEDALDVQRTSGLKWFSLLAQNPKAFMEQLHADEVMKAMNREPSKKRSKFRKKAAKTGRSLSEVREKEPPLSSMFNVGSSLGAVSEKFDDALESYIAKDPEGHLKQAEDRMNAKSVGHKAMSKDTFRQLCYIKFSRCLVDPGEAVGAIAAQSIGEPSTQMTLNTFHSAGQGGNVTLGIPRLREIVMTATAFPAAANMTISLNPSFVKKKKGGKAAARAVSLHLQRVSLFEFVDKTRVEEKLVRRGGHLLRQYRVILQMGDLERICKEKDIGSVEEVIAAAKYEFPDAVMISARKEVQKAARILKKRGVNAGTGFVSVEDRKMAKKAGDGEDEEDEEGNSSNNRNRDDEGEGHSKKKRSSNNKSGAVEGSSDEEEDENEDDDDDDGNGRDTAKKGRKEVRGYDDDDDDDDGAAAADNEDVLEDDDSERDGDGEDDDGESVGSESNRKKPMMKKKNEEEDSMFTSQSMQLKARFLAKSKWVDDARTMSVTMHLDISARKLVMLSLAEAAAQKVVIKETKGIKNIFVLEPSNKQSDDFKIQTDGVNFDILASPQLRKMVNVHSVRSSDIHKILRTYGVEAACKAIQEELGAVFDSYGIAVSTRHLSLIADHMTFLGDYRAMNRMAMTNNASPFLKMSFETTCRFLTDAAIIGDRDSMKSPSARVALGQPVQVGTNSFELLHPLEYTTA